MRILIVDDDMERHAGFDSMLPQHDLVHVKNARDAFKSISSITADDKFDAMFLDHDLGELQPPQFIKDDYGAGGTRELNGNDVARRVAELPAPLRPKYVLIHSWNPSGAENMNATLQGKIRNMDVKRYSPTMFPKGWGV